MTWKNIDWIAVQGHEYETALNDQVREVFGAAQTVLEKTFQARYEWYQNDLSKATNEADADAANDQLMYAEFRWDEQNRALTTMALALLASINKWFLDQEKILFKTTHPASSHGYNGRSQLEKQISEYMERFGVDLKTINGFETLREVDLARNCCLHNEGALTTDYKNQTRQRLVGKNGNIQINSQMLDTLLLELAAFSQELCGRLRAVANANRPTETIR